MANAGFVGNLSGFCPADLEPYLATNKIDGTVVVQATDTEAETEYLLSLADKFDWILGVVGWVDMEKSTAPAQIAEFAEHPKFVGIRPMIQGLADDAWMLRPTLEPAISALIEPCLSGCHPHPLHLGCSQSPE